VIVADTDGAGFIPADAALQVNEAGVGVPTANLANPPIPAGVHFQARAVHHSVRTTKNTNSTNPVAATVPGVTATADLDACFAAWVTRKKGTALYFSFNLSLA
jgi:hypothetical protein